MTKERHSTPPIFPPPTPTRYECTNCGHILPKDRSLPATCPVCGAPKEAFVLVEEDWDVPLSRSQLARYRHAVVGAHRVQTKAQALRFVNAVGFCYAFTAGPGELPALFDVLATRSIDRMWSWAWRWKDELASERRLFYGRLVRRKPTLISLHYLPHFFALTGNVGEPDDYLQTYREGRLGMLARDVYEYVREHGRCSTWTLRRQFVPRGGRSGALQRALTSLQERCLIAKAGEVESGSFSFIWDTFDRWMPQVVRTAGRLSADVAAATLLERYLRTVGVVPEHTAATLFAMDPSLFSRARQATAATVISGVLDGEAVLVHEACLRMRR